MYCFTEGTSAHISGACLYVWRQEGGRPPHLTIAHQTLEDYMGYKVERKHKKETLPISVLSEAVLLSWLSLYPLYPEMMSLLQSYYLLDHCPKPLSVAAELR